MTGMVGFFPLIFAQDLNFLRTFSRKLQLPSETRVFINLTFNGRIMIMGQWLNPNVAVLTNQKLLSLLFGALLQTTAIMALARKILTVAIN